MMNTSKKPKYNVARGTVIKGKWHYHAYTVHKTLGYGATGTVYLAKGKEGLVALKISDDSMAITSEVNVLRHFSKVQGCLGPSLLDVDDWVFPGQGKVLHFYVMDYLKGDDFLSFINKNGDEWLSVLVLQLLSDLDQLHEKGWVFGDLKPDNLLVVGPPSRVRWLDVGGTTMKGRSIKEFTEFFDRGYWGMGSRKAEPSYDLFAVAMIMINSAYPHRFSKKGEFGNHLQELVKAVQAAPTLRKSERVIIKAIQGRYPSAGEMRQELIEAISPQIKQSKPVNQSTTKTNSKSIPTTKTLKNARQMKRKADRRTRFRGVFETLLMAIFLLIAYFLYIAGHMM
ncbi:MAG TPA: serine/threonine protein kinase [Bacillales bacterium]|nr:serine/threonine protein kinase [Bacillales bacterium]